MTVSSLGLSLSVTGIPVEVDFDTRLNIKKRRENIVYRTLSDQDNINISYVKTLATNPSNNLSIADRSTSLVQNRVPPDSETIIFTGSSFTLNVSKFVITDIFTTETPTCPEKPLFYAHRLKNFNSTNTDWGDKTLLHIEFTNYLFERQNITEYYADESTGYIYNNIENSYDQSTGDFTVYYVKYTVKTTVGFTQTTTIYHELLSNHPVYHEASFSDIDEFGNLDINQKAYLINELSDGSSFEIILPIYQTYAYKELTNSRIKILPPTALSINEPWGVRISNGEFITSLQTGASSYTNHKYHIAEFNNQSFNPYYPYKLYIEQESVWLYENLIKTAKNIAYDTSLNLYTTVLIEDQNKDIKYAYSNDPAKINTPYSSSLNYTDGILSIDSVNGFIELLDDIDDTDTIYVSYYSETDDYDFTPVNFNPISNLDILNKRIVIYAVPETFTTGALDKTLYYMSVNPIGEILYNSQVVENSTAIDPGTIKLLDEDFNANGTPKHLFYYDKISTSSGLNWRPSGLYSSYFEDFSFIDKYTTESYLLTSGTPTGGNTLQNFIENPRYLVLGDIFIDESTSGDFATKFDVRVQGGGIKEGFDDTVANIQQEAIWFYDMGGRLPYPGTDTFLVEVPNTLLSDNGGSFTKNQIKDTVKKHSSFGSYPMVRSYGIDPTINRMIAESGQFYIEWPTYDYGTTYNIYASVDLETGFYKNNISEIADSGTTNFYTVTGLNTNTKYYTYIVANRDDILNKGPMSYIITGT